MEAWEVIALFAVTFVAAFVHAVSGFGFALFIMPPLSALIGPKEAVALSSVFGIWSNTRVYVSSWRDTDWALCLPMLLGAAVGMPIGIVVLLTTDTNILKAIMAVVVLLSTLLIWRGWKLARHGRPLSAGVGLISGILNTSTSMNGPPIVLYLQGMQVEPARFRGTIAAFFTASNFIAVTLLAANGAFSRATIGQSVVGFPALLVGYAVGYRVFQRIDAIRFRQVVIGILLISGVVALLTATLG